MIYTNYEPSAIAYLYVGIFAGKEKKSSTAAATLKLFFLTRRPMYHDPDELIKWYWNPTPDYRSHALYFNLGKVWSCRAFSSAISLGRKFGGGSEVDETHSLSR